MRRAAKLRFTENVPEDTRTKERADVTSPEANGSAIDIGEGVFESRTSAKETVVGVPASTAKETVTFVGRSAKTEGLTESSRTALYTTLNRTDALGSPFGMMV